MQPAQPAQPAAPRLQPMQMSDMLDGMFRLYRQNFVTFVGVVAVLQIPVIALQVLLTLLFGEQAMTDMFNLSSQFTRSSLDPTFNPLTNLSFDNILGFYSGLLIVGLIQGIIVLPLINGALIYAISRSYMREPVAILAAYDFGIDRMVNLIIAGILVGIIVVLPYLIGFVLFALAFVPTVFFDASESVGLFGVLLVLLGLVGVVVGAIFMFVLTIMLIFVPHAIVIEGANPLAAIRRSLRLVSGSFWRILGIMIVFAIMIFIISAILTSPAQMSPIFLDPLEDIVLIQAFNTLVTYGVQILILPMQVALATLLYYDIRVRKEGYDLELQAQAFGSGAADPTVRLEGGH